MHLARAIIVCSLCLGLAPAARATVPSFLFAGRAKSKRALQVRQGEMVHVLGRDEQGWMHVKTDHGSAYRIDPKGLAFSTPSTGGFRVGDNVTFKGNSAVVTDTVEGHVLVRWHGSPPGARRQTSAIGVEEMDLLHHLK
jgi:hypothetical protein